MIRALSILAAVAALAVSAAPLASAGTSKKPPSQTYVDKSSVDMLAMNPKAAPRSMFHGSGGDGAKFLRHGAAKAPATTQLQTFSGDAYVNEMG